MRDMDSRQIIEREIESLRAKYRSVQDRYACTGSASSDRTMHKYSTLIDALERSLAPSDREQYDSRLHRIQKVVDIQHANGFMSRLAYDQISDAIKAGRG